MYQTLDDNNVDLSVHLKKTTQSSVTGIPSAATAGVMTTRGAASAFFVNGTNRAMFRFTMINHLCNDLPTVMDTTRPPDRIRQDVTRSPGGVSTLFLTNCIGCHSGMDPMAQAFAYYNFSYPASEIGATAWPDRPDRVHRRPDAAEVSHQQHQFPARVQHAGRQLEQPLAHRPESGARLERIAHRRRERRQVAGPGAREQRGVQHLPGDQSLQDGVLPRARRPPTTRERATRTKSTRWSRHSNRATTRCGRYSRSPPRTAWEIDHESQTITRDDDSRGLVGPRRLRRRRRRQLRVAHGRSHQQRRRLYGTRAGDGGRAGLRGQSLEQHPRPEPLRSVPQRHDAGADAELRAQRQCEPRLRAGQHGGQPRAALDLRNGGEGQRRAQLLARRSERLRPDLDHVDQQLGECHGRRVGDAGRSWWLRRCNRRDRA